MGRGSGYTSSSAQLGAAEHWGWGWHFVSQVGSSSQPLSVEQIGSALLGTRLGLCRSDWALETSLLCFYPHGHPGKFWLCTLRAAFTALQSVPRKEGFLAFALFIIGKMISICEVSSHVLWRGKSAGNLGSVRDALWIVIDWALDFASPLSALENQTLNIFM